MTPTLPLSIYLTTEGLELFYNCFTRWSEIFLIKCKFLKFSMWENWPRTPVAIPVAIYLNSGDRRNVYFLGLNHYQSFGPTSQVGSSQMCSCYLQII